MITLEVALDALDMDMDTSQNFGVGKIVDFEVAKIGTLCGELFN